MQAPGGLRNLEPPSQRAALDSVSPPSQQRRGATQSLAVTRNNLSAVVQDFMDAIFQDLRYLVLEAERDPEATPAKRQ
jgi:hypothetical protein